jgi:inosine-uridine nucleoside N-ribohydrolase
VSGERVRVWVDTDIGGDPDDAVALMLAVRHPRAELVGVSTVDKDVEHRARLARALLEQLGSDAPVHPGMIPANALDGVDALVAIGPLTNVARLVAGGATLPRLVVMGGALAPVEHRGIVYEVEHNFSTDPAAAAQVVRESDRFVLVPLDVTAALRLEDHEADALGRVAGVVADEIAAWRERDDSPVCLHDPLALLVLLEDAVVEREPRALAVDETGKVGVGPTGVVHEVVVRADAVDAVQRTLRACTAPAG